MTLDNFHQQERLDGKSSQEPLQEFPTSVSLVLSFLEDSKPAIRESSLNRLIELRSQYNRVPPQLAEFLLHERDARLVAKGVETLSSCVSRDPLATSLLTHFLSDPRQLVAQRARGIVETMSDIPLEIRYPYQSSLASTYAVEASRARAKELYQKIHPYLVVEGAALGKRPFLEAVEALCLPISQLQEVALEVLVQRGPLFNERQRGVVEAACTYSFNQVITGESRTYEGLLGLLREVSTSTYIARIVQGIETGEDINLRLHRDFTATYISRADPLPQALEELLTGLWHNIPLVVDAVASNIGVLLAEFPREIGERILDEVFEALVTRAGEGTEFIAGLLAVVRRQSSYEESIMRRVSEIVATTESSQKLMVMLEVIRVNPPQLPRTMEVVTGILRYLAGANNAGVAAAARRLLEFPESEGD